MGKRSKRRSRRRTNQNNAPTKRTFSSKLHEFTESNKFWAGGVAFVLAGLTLELFNASIIFSFVLVAIGGIFVTVTIFVHELASIFWNSITGFLIMITLLCAWWFLLPQSSDNRPMLNIDVARLEAPIASGKFPVAKVDFENSGNAMARNVQLSWHHAFLKAPATTDIERGIPPPNGQSAETGSSGPLPAKDKARFTTRNLGYANESTRFEIVNGDNTFYVWGEIKYEDIAGKAYTAKFCLRNSDKKSVNLEFCAAGNEISHQSIQFPRQIDSLRALSSGRHRKALLTDHPKAGSNRQGGVTYFKDGI